VLVSERPEVPIFAQWQGREFPVRWPWFRPEPEPGDVVRLNVDGGPEWRSFRVVARRDRRAGDDDTRRVAIDVDVEPVGGT